MQELLELQTGQVSFLSGLLAGFSLTVAANILQIESGRLIHKICLLFLLLATLLFLVALYVDVRLTIEVASMTELSPATTEIIERTRFIGTSSATLAFVVFVIAVGMLGWLAGPVTGCLSTVLAGLSLAVLGYVWLMILSIGTS